MEFKKAHNKCRFPGCYAQTPHGGKHSVLCGVHFAQYLRQDITPVEEFITKMREARGNTP